MTVANSTLVSRFYTGDESGKANRMEIKTADDGSTILWGYGWAIYALRTPTGTVYKFTGWEGHSSTTTQHMRLIRGAEVKEVDAKPETVIEAQDAAAKIA